ncbi:acetyltransferases [Longilinea arvoryzae]|uniref:Acetyltransferases n=1 Tax=Longilinea arvoryzae TaxID=360412 RepID=A0A0S7BFC7_9CHLR|nr:GNAT family N-acetyltransferase [Longilinea arvoryzae]GAP13267.1 acetyltransferases [Longilinea arvoryzae]
METVTLRKITRENWERIIDLKVRDEQKRFVASNLYSLAEAKVFPDCVPLAIYAAEQPVGFLMYAYENDRREWWIFRLMIAEEEQGKGYGRAAMRLGIERMRANPDCDRIFISFEPENSVAEQLYRSLGFVPNHEILGGEVVYRLDPPQKSETA